MNNPYLSTMRSCSVTYKQVAQSGFVKFLNGRSLRPPDVVFGSKVPQSEGPRAILLPAPISRRLPDVACMIPLSPPLEVPLPKPSHTCSLETRSQAVQQDFSSTHDPSSHHSQTSKSNSQPQPPKVQQPTQLDHSDHRSPPVPAS
jgi:hypothetical protein